MNYAMVGVVMLFVATCGSYLLIYQHHKDKSKQVKWALFVLYFWLANFLQLIVLGLYYQLFMH